MWYVQNESTNCVYIIYIYSLQELFGEVPRREQHVSHMSDCHSPEPSTAVHRVRVYRRRQTHLSQCKPQSSPVGVHQGTPVDSSLWLLGVVCMRVLSACHTATWVFEGGASPSSSLSEAELLMSRVECFLFSAHIQRKHLMMWPESFTLFWNRITPCDVI